MTLTTSRLAAMVLVLAIAPLPVIAQTHTQAQPIYSQAELDQMLAPVALYPDPLLSQVLMAATYPLEVAEAARWSRANPGLQGDDAVRAAQSEDWDPSVQSLVAFPQILARMDENPDWTRRLGEAFLEQEPHVMDTVQQLRRRAQAAGNLQSSEQMYVEQQGQAIVLQPTSPQYVYVPYYDPSVAYGPWWWPAYPPIAWAPWAGYARPYRPGVSVGFWWGRPVGLSVDFFFGNLDWRHRHARVARPTAYYYRPPAAVTAVLRPHRWRHEARRRDAFAERRPVPVRQGIQMQSRVQRPEPRVAISPERQERRIEQVQELPQSRSQVNAPPSMQVQPAAQTWPPAQVLPRRKGSGDRDHIQRREQRNESLRMQRRQEVRPDQLPQLSQPQIRHERRARAPEAIAAQQPRAQPEIRPQPHARPQQPEQRRRMREAPPPRQSRAERPEQRNGRGH